MTENACNKGGGAYLFGGDHDADFLDSLGELFSLDSAVVVQIEVLEGLQQNGLIVLHSIALLSQLGLKRLLETVRQTNESLIR